ncbi:MAG TPA: hypothetical protein VJR22_01430 [Candidatus Nitrosotalea sp.]|nr:hypothetical protein [Nitrososphaerota archaeon]MDE2589559.1 hypothetical protein [Patescibacteria group bacterium]HKU32491.1 hypothetical protein [Candidatus Nitrosotalea sp.]
MVLSKKEKTAIIISNAITLYSLRMQDEKISEYQSVIDFVLKNMPEEFRTDLSMELIDDVFTFISEQHLKVS